MSTPLTPECARSRSLLDRRLEQELPADEEAALEDHLRRCVPCRRVSLDLHHAFAALASLSTEDRARLSSPLAELERERARSLRVALGFGVLAALLVVGLGVYLWLQAPAAAPPQVPELPQAQAGLLALPEVGGGLGVEQDPDYVTIRPEVAPSPVEVVLAARPEPAAPQPAAPAPLVAKGPPRPLPPAPQPKPKAPPPQPVAPKAPLPQLSQDLLARLQISTGLRYRGVTFFFVRDPNDRKRLSSKKSPRPASAREAKNRAPGAVVVRPPAGRSGAHLLLGELLDAPFGLRIAPTTQRLQARATLPVIPVRYEPLARTRPKPLLKGAVVLPSSARLAQAQGSKQGPVAILLELLNDPDLDAMDRLRIELGEIESEAADLERRIRAMVGRTRGLTGLAYSVGGQTRSLDVFASPHVLAESLPKLIRAALLEDRLGRPYNRDAAVDPRSTAIERGVTEGRQDVRDLVTLLATAREAPLQPAGPVRKIDGRYEAEAADRRAGVVLSEGGRLVHALAFVPSSVTATKR